MKKIKPSNYIKFINYINKTLLIFTLYFCILPFQNELLGQGKVVTVPPVNGTTQWGGITFNLRADQSIKLDTIFTNTSGTTGTNDLEVWYRTTPINGQPTTAEFTGSTPIWIPLIANQSVPAGTDLAPIVIPGGLVIPANSHYGFYIGDPAFTNTGIRYGSSSSVDSVTDGNVTVIMGTNIGYGWVRNGTTINHPRFFAGGVAYSRGITVPNDAAVLSVDSPTVFCAGTHSIYATIGNAGSNQIDSVNIHWEIDGIAQPPIQYVGLLDTLNGSNPNTAQINLGNYTFISGATEIMVYTSNPNGIADTSNLDDTVRVLRGPALNGTYTIDQNNPTSGTNFNSFSDFTDALSTFGVCGPVTANVVVGSGPYNQQVIFNSYSGASASSSVTINANGETVEYAPSSSDKRIVGFDNASYISIKNLKVVGLDPTYGFGIHFTNASHHISIDSTEVDLTLATSTSSTNVGGFISSSSVTSMTTTGNNASNISITNSKVDGGITGMYYAVRFNGNSSSDLDSLIRFENNEVANFYAYGIYLNHIKNSYVGGNDIHRADKQSVTTFYGITTSGGSTNDTINANRIHNTHGSATSLTGTSYGIYNTSNDANASSPNLFVNNLIYDFNSNGTIYAIYNTGSDNQVYVHNTISLDYTSATGGITRGFYQTTAASGIFFANNNISITRGGSGTKHVLYFNTSTSNITSNYNNLYINSAGSGLQYVGRDNAIDHLTLTNWQTNTSHGTNSHDANPLFLSVLNDNYVPNTPVLNNSGLSLPQVTEDFSGAPRSATPDIGAYEFTIINSNPSLLSFESPVEDFTSCFSSTENVEIIVSNNGLNPMDFSVDTAIIEVNVTGAIIQTISSVINDNSFNGGVPLAPDSSMIVLVGTIDMSAEGMYNIESILLSSNDEFNADDTIRTNIEVKVEGGNITGNDSFCDGDTVDLTLNGSAGTIQWQKLVNGVFVDEVGANSEVYRVYVDSTTSFRSISCGSEVSDTITVVITELYGNGDTVIVNCGSSGSAILKVTSNQSGIGYNWYDSPTSTTVLSNLDSLIYTVNTNPGIAQTYTDTFYVSGGASQSTNIGAPNNGQASGYTLEAGLFFDVFAPSVTINGVYVYPLGTGAGTAEIGIKETSTGNIIHTTTVNLTGSTPGVRTYVPLGFTIPTGNDYQMLWLSKSGGVTSLIRDASSAITGGGFPFTVPGVMSITDGQCCSANTVSTSYYYFYDWDITTGCESPRIPVIGTVQNIPNTTPPTAMGDTAIVFCGDSGTVYLTASSSIVGGTFNWYSDASSTSSIGSGDTLAYGLNTSNQAATTTYNDSLYVSVIDPVSNCESERTLVNAVIVCTVGENELATAKGNIVIAPNPSKGMFNITANGLNKGETGITVRDISGKTIYSETVNVSSDNFKSQINLEGQAKGIYFISVTNKDQVIHNKVVIQ